jgi:hypothetical protein
MEYFHKNDLIAKRGCRCELCGLTKWKGQPINNLLKVGRKDKYNLAHTSDNVLLLCVMCFHQGGYNKRLRRKKPDFADIARRASREPLKGPVTFAHDRQTQLAAHVKAAADEFEANKNKERVR